MIRLNSKAYNPITKKINKKLVWEVEQCATGDGFSEKVKWHCADVRIDDTPIQSIWTFPKKGEPPTEMTFYGLALRDPKDDAVVIQTKSKHEVM